MDLKEIRKYGEGFSDLGYGKIAGCFENFNGPTFSINL